MRERKTGDGNLTAFELSVVIRALDTYDPHPADFPTMEEAVTDGQTAKAVLDTLRELAETEPYRVVLDARRLVPGP